MTRASTLLLATLAALAAAGAASAQPRCPGTEALVSHRLEMRPAEVSRDRTLADLRGAAQGRGAGHPIGLYFTHLVGGTSVDMRVTPVGDRQCIAVGRVDIRFEMRTRMIYVARELPPDSCLFRVTLEHERQHEQIDEDSIRRRLPPRVQDMRYDFSNLATSAPVGANERDQVVREFRARAQAIVDRMLVQLFEERERAQAALDTPQEYERIGARCR